MSTTDKPWRSSAAALVVAAAAAAVGFAAVYVTFGRPDNGKPAPPSPAVTAGPAAAPTPTPSSAPAPAPGERNPLAAGAMTAFVFKKTPEALADIAFTDGNKTPRTLKDFAGKTVLLNLWATWCTPCREEMPGLDRLQKALGSDKFEVVALSIDRGGADASRKFLDSIKVESLRLYVDATARAGGQLKAVGLPTTLLVDGHGREIGRFIGPAAWDGPDARRLIEASIK